MPGEERFGDVVDVDEHATGVARHRDRGAGVAHRGPGVQSVEVTHLPNPGWRVLSVADTAARAHGTDIVAVNGGERVGIEVTPRCA